jgi:predicted acetyltransferase
MKIVIKNNKNITNNCINDIGNLLKNSFKDNFISNNIINILRNKNHINSDFKIIQLLNNNILVGIAICDIRYINFLEEKVKSLTIGPVAIATQHQKKGYSKVLMNAIDNLAYKLNIKIGYLGGIDNFYSKYNYFPCMSKSKVVINIKDIKNTTSAKYENYKPKHLNEIKTLYSNFSLKYNLSSRRSNEVWGHLFKGVSCSFHFYDPQIVLFKNKVIGYFCTDPVEKYRIREAVYLEEIDSIKEFTLCIVSYALKNNLDKIEIMTSINSNLLTHLKINYSFTYIEYLKKSGGQLMKLFDIDFFAKLYSDKISNNFFKIQYSIKNDSIHFECRLNDNINKSFYCEKEYFPGLLSNYYSIEIASKNFNTISKKIKKIILNKIPNKQPFIFQGDNY